MVEFPDSPADSTEDDRCRPSLKDLFRFMGGEEDGSTGSEKTIYEYRFLVSPPNKDLVKKKARRRVKLRAAKYNTGRRGHRTGYLFGELTSLMRGKSPTLSMLRCVLTLHWVRTDSSLSTDDVSTHGTCASRQKDDDNKQQMQQVAKRLPAARQKYLIITGIWLLICSFSVLTWKW